MPKYDDFDDQNDVSAFSRILSVMDRNGQISERKPALAFASVAAVIVLLIAVIWYSYPREASRQEMESAPLIRADGGPIKTAPDKPGGMDIPYRESTVFDSLRSSDADKRVENLLPEAEKPVDREQAFAGLKTDIGPSPLEQESEPAEIPAAKDTLPQPKPVAPASAEAEPTDDAGEASGAPQPLTVEAPVTKTDAPEETTKPVTAKLAPVAETPAVKPAGNGTKYVQLASIKDRAAAPSAWKGLQRQFSQLSALDYRVNQANLGARGTFYRVQAGPLSEADAKTLCTAINGKKPGSCIVVGR